MKSSKFLQKEGMRMKDRYLFRGKRIDNGKWEYGCLLVLDVEDYRIATSCLESADEPLYVQAYKVDLSTVCQCIGHDDKNANQIFEYDIVKFKEHIGVVMWNEESASYCVKVPRYVFPYFFGTSCFADKLEIVGNKFDNPELWEVRK